MTVSRWLVPPPLQPGDAVRVVAPSGPFEARLVFRGLGWLSERYEVRFDRGLFASTGYLAGTDERRREEFARALVEPGISAILCARGGYGASRFAHDLDWSSLRSAPRWLVGFSDVTALHLEANALGVASIHGPNVTALGRGDAVTRDGLVQVLEHPARLRTYEGLESLALGRARGPLFGGNLTLVHACATAGRLRVPNEAVLFLEDVTERPYRIDRMLTTLRAGGYFERVSSFVFGEFTGCEPGGDGVSVRDVVREVLGPLGKPIAWGLTSGHGIVNEPLVFGADAALESTHEGASLRLSLA